MKLLFVLFTKGALSVYWNVVESLKCEIQHSDVFMLHPPYFNRENYIIIIIIIIIIVRCALSLYLVLSSRLALIH